MTVAYPLVDLYHPDIRIVGRVAGITGFEIDVSSPGRLHIEVNVDRDIVIVVLGRRINVIHQLEHGINKQREYQYKYRSHCSGARYPEDERLFGFFLRLERG